MKRKQIEPTPAVSTGVSTDVLSEFSPVLSEEKEQKELRLCNVQPPWSELLVQGVKDVENRKNPPKLQLPAWIGVVESQTRVTERTTQRAAKLLALMDKDLSVLPQHMVFEKGKQPQAKGVPQLVGFIRVDACTTESKSIWYDNSPTNPFYDAETTPKKIGWVVGASFSLPPKRRVTLKQGSQCQLFKACNLKDPAETRAINSAFMMCQDAHRRRK